MNTALRNLVWPAYRTFVRYARWTRIGQVWPFERLHLRALSHLRPDVVEFDQHSVHLDLNDNCKLSYDHVHDFELSFLSGQLGAGDVVLDIGANIGLYTLTLARRVGPTGRVFAFEPEPSNCALLRKNIEQNGYHNVTIFEKAVSDRSGKCNLYLSKTHGGLHRTYQSRACSGSVVIESVRLDDIADLRDQEVNLIKIDVEGAEPRVLAGMGALLGRSRNLKLFMEFVPKFLLEQGLCPDEVLSWLRAEGFELFRVDSRMRKVQRVTPREYRQARVRGMRQTNLWCLRPTE